MIKYFQLIRIPNLIIATLAVLVATYSIKGHDLLLLLYAIISVVCTMSFGNILNDVLDLYPDKISHPSRPLPMNNIKLGIAKNIVFIFLILILIISLFLNIFASIFLLCIILPLLICYNLYFKGVPVIGNVVISMLLAFVFIFTEIVFYGKAQTMLAPACLVFGLSFIREFIKDIQDYKGDKYYNIKTLPVMIGQQQSINIAIFMIIVFCVLILIPYFANYYQINYLISLIILVEIPLIILVSLLLRNPNKLMLRKVSFMIKIISCFGLLVILIANS